MYNRKKDTKDQKKASQPLNPKQAILIDTLPAGVPSVRGCFEFQPPDECDRHSPDEIAGIATCYFRGVCTDIALLAPEIKLGAEDNHLREYINQSNIVIYAATDLAAAKLFIERYLPVKSENPSELEQLVYNDSDMIKHVYVAQDEKVAAHC